MPTINDKNITTIGTQNDHLAREDADFTVFKMKVVIVGKKFNVS